MRSIDSSQVTFPTPVQPTNKTRDYNGFSSIYVGGFYGAWLYFGGQELGYAFGAAMCKIQAKKRYIESLPY